MGVRGRWAIDNHDVVVRFNLIRQQQLRNHTGTRATIRMLNHASATHLCKLGSEWHNATTQYSVASIIKRLPEWAQYKWREYQVSLLLRGGICNGLSGTMCAMEAVRIHVAAF